MAMVNVRSATLNQAWKFTSDSEFASVQSLLQGTAWSEQKHLQSSGTSITITYACVVTKGSGNTGGVATFTPSGANASYGTQISVQWSVGDYLMNCTGASAGHFVRVIAAADAPTRFLVIGADNGQTGLLNLTLTLGQVAGPG